MVGKESSKKNQPTNPKKKTKRHEIDRDQEDADVMLYKKTKDDRVFERIYKNRLSTLRYLSNKYRYLHDSTDDMFSFISDIFVRCIDGYEKTRASTVNGKKVTSTTPFNTYFYTSVLHRVKNLDSANNAQKRRPDKPVLSLDYEYSGRNGDPLSLLEMLGQEPEDPRSSPTIRMSLADDIALLADGDSDVERVLSQIVQGNTLADLVRDSKRIKGQLQLSKRYAKTLREKSSCKRAVKNLIKDAEEFESFTLVDYGFVGDDIVEYEVELPTTAEAEIIKKTIRKIRRNRDSYRQKLNGADEENSFA